MYQKTQSSRYFPGILLFVFFANLFLGVGGVSARAFAAEGNPIVVKVGTTSDEPRIWNAVQKNLDAAGENIKIEIVYLTPGNPNEFLAAGEIDLNAFQHYAYLEKNS
ncbi:MAG: hypothetical protein LBJ22_04320, partial [Synergistaceae bacterium]|nr:hypothetical protein [Synergistaceae bacterium]